MSKLEALKTKACDNPEVKTEYDRLENCSIYELTGEENELKEWLDAKPVGKEII